MNRQGQKARRWMGTLSCVTAFLLLALSVPAPLEAQAEMQVTGRLPTPLRFETPAVFTGVEVKMAQVAIPGADLVADGQGISAPAGTFPAGEYVAFIRAGQKAAEGQAAADGSLAAPGAVAGRVWLVHAQEPIPDVGFARFPTNMTGVWISGVWGYSADGPAAAVGVQYSGFLTHELWIRGEADWMKIASISYSSSYYAWGFAEAGGVLYWGGYSPWGTSLSRWQGDSWVSMPIPPGSSGSIAAKASFLLSAGDRLYAGTPSGLYRWSESAWVKIGPAVGNGDVAITPASTVYGRVKDPSGLFCVKKWDGTAWQTLSCPLDGGTVAPQLALGAGRLWALCGNQVTRFDGSEWSTPESISGVTLKQVAPAGDGSAWAVVDNAGTLQLAYWTEDGGWVLGPLMPLRATQILGYDRAGGMHVGGAGGWDCPVPIYRLPCAVGL